jgi:hypothetical protein
VFPESGNNKKKFFSYIPTTSFIVLTAITVVGAIPPKAIAISLITLLLSSNKTLKPAFTIAISSSFLWACL